eukprot:7387620-Pyramimonas_sp.AAC.1
MVAARDGASARMVFVSLEAHGAARPERSAPQLRSGASAQRVAPSAPAHHASARHAISASQPPSL